MARQIIVLLPEFPQFNEKITLGDTQFIFRFQFRRRQSSWYLDIEQLDGTPVILGRRLSPRWGPTLAIPLNEIPKSVGVLYVRGPDPYAREDLGGRLQLIFSPAADLPVSPADPDAPTITLL